MFFRIKCFSRSSSLRPLTIGTEKLLLAPSLHEVGSVMIVCQFYMDFLDFGVLAFESSQLHESYARPISFSAPPLTGIIADSLPPSRKYRCLL